MITKGEAYQTLATINRLQTLASIPLLITAPFSQGVGHSISGGTAFISPTGLAATDNEQNAYETASICAREARSLGFHLSFSPFSALVSEASDFNSFGQNPDSVASFCRATIRGLQENGLLACGTSFPAEGLSDFQDSILAETLLSLQEWQQTGLIPFVEAIRNGVAAIMVANSALPNIDQGFQRPASFSPYLLSEILRDKLKYDGLIISDVLTEPWSHKYIFSGSAAVKAFNAGVDLLILEENIPIVFNALR